MPDRLNQVVAGEPSLGTPHEHVQNFYQGASLAVGNYTLTYTGAPSGAKRAFVWIWANFTNTGSMGFSNTAGTIRYGESSAGAGQYNGLSCPVTLDANKQFRLAINTALTSVVCEASFYDT